MPCAARRGALGETLVAVGTLGLARTPAPVHVTPPRGVVHLPVRARRVARIRPLPAKPAQLFQLASEVRGRRVVRRARRERRPPCNFARQEIVRRPLRSANEKQKPPWACSAAGPCRQRCSAKRDRRTCADNDLQARRTAGTKRQDSWPETGRAPRRAGGGRSRSRRRPQSSGRADRRRRSPPIRRARPASAPRARSGTPRSPVVRRTSSPGKR